MPGHYRTMETFYLEAGYAVDESGRFGMPIPDRGVLLREDQYSYIELFAIPSEERASAEELREISKSLRRADTSITFPTSVLSATVLVLALE